MDTDQLLRDAGSAWRDAHATPLAVPSFAAMDAEHPPAGAPARRRGGPRFALRPVVAAALVAVAVVVAAWQAAHTGTPGRGPAPAESRPGPVVTTPGSASPGTPAPPPRDCADGQLAASFGSAGPADGTENVWILVRNVDSHPCRLGGLLPLSGVRDDGTAVTLGFTGSTDPAYADPGPVTGPGAVAPGGYGTFHLTVALNNCPAPAEHYRTLRIGLPGGGHADMAYPTELTLGCPGYEAPAGPIPSPGVLPGR